MLPKNKVKGLVPPACVVNALCLIACKDLCRSHFQQGPRAGGLVAAEQAKCMTCFSTRPQTMCLSQGCLHYEGTTSLGEVLGKWPPQRQYKMHCEEGC